MGKAKGPPPIVTVSTPNGVECTFTPRAVQDVFYEFDAHFKIPWNVVGQKGVDYQAEMKAAFAMAMNKYVEEMKNR